MSSKKLSIAFAAFAALGAVLASSALAGTPKTEAAAWVKTSGGVPQTISSSQGVTCRHTVGEANFVFTSKVLGQDLEITASGISCSGAVIKTEGSGSNSMAVAEGVLEFTGISVKKPSGCTAPSTLKTNTLVGDLTMDKTEPKLSYLGFSPKSGTTIANIKLEKCAAAGTYPLNGFFYLEHTAQTGMHFQNQQFVANTTTQGMSGMLLGKEIFLMSGGFEIELTSGALWGAEHP